MAKTAFAFEFDPPSGWREGRDGSRFIFMGPKNEELIISGAAISGSGVPAEYGMIKSRLHENSLAAMRKAAEHPDLVTDRPLRQGSTLSGLRCWTIESHSRNGNVLFLQGAVLTDAGALLATLEADFDEEARALFRQLLNTVREPGTHMPVQ